MYIKISSKASKNYNIDEIVSLSLISDQEIKNMQVIDNNRILITIVANGEIQGVIFDDCFNRNWTSYNIYLI